MFKFQINCKLKLEALTIQQPQVFFRDNCKQFYYVSGSLFHKLGLYQSLNCKKKAD